MHLTASSSPLLLVLLLIALAIQETPAKPTGAPELACVDMTPRHKDNVPQTAPNPYLINVVQFAQNRFLVTVTSGDPSSLHFKGFLLQARDPNTDAPLGAFAYDVGLARSVACSEAFPNAAITHVDPHEKDLLNVTWTPPEGQAFVGGVTFKVTLVKQFDTFWTGLEAKVAAGAPVVPVVVPSAPVGPAGPVAPVVPAAAVGSAAPVAPSAPVGPVAPDASVGPATQLGPVAHAAAPADASHPQAVAPGAPDSTIRAGLSLEFSAGPFASAPASAPAASTPGNDSPPSPSGPALTAGNTTVGTAATADNSSTAANVTGTSNGVNAADATHHDSHNLISSPDLGRSMSSFAAASADSGSSNHSVDNSSHSADSNHTLEDAAAHARTASVLHRAFDRLNAWVASFTRMFHM